MAKPVSYFIDRNDNPLKTGDDVVLVEVQHPSVNFHLYIPLSAVAPVQPEGPDACTCDFTKNQWMLGCRCGFMQREREREDERVSATKQVVIRIVAAGKNDQAVFTQVTITPEEHKKAVG